MVAADTCDAFRKPPPVIIENNWAAVIVVYIVLFTQRIVLGKFLKEVSTLGYLIREKIRNCGIDAMMARNKKCRRELFFLLDCLE
jgi:hypothetical protein